MLSIGLIMIAASEKQRGKKDYWQNELRSLGIDTKRRNELNDKEELAALAENIKQVYYKEYKTAYDDDIGDDDPRFDGII
jgi:hypothetical protein